MNQKGDFNRAIDSFLSLWGMATIGDSLRQTVSTLFSFCQKPKSTFNMVTKKVCVIFTKMPTKQYVPGPCNYWISGWWTCFKKGLRTILNYWKCRAASLSIWTCDIDVFREETLILQNGLNDRKLIQGLWHCGLHLAISWVPL